MSQKDLVKITRQKVEEINEKIRELEEILKQDSKKELSERARSVLEQLEEIRTDVENQFNILEQSKSNSVVQLNEFEKNIYNSIEVFDAAFTKAGTLFKTKTK